jgi:putative GTP pyrophosphokinase
LSEGLSSPRNCNGRRLRPVKINRVLERAHLTKIKKKNKIGIMDFSFDFFKKPFEKLEEKFYGRINQRMETMQKFIAYYRCALMEIETKFKVLNEELSFLHERNPIDTIKTRIKDFDSIYKKLRQRNFPLSLNSIEKNIHDIAGIRIICPFIDDIYMLVDCILRQDDIKLFEKKDYIANPKENGYRSLHLIIEIPIFLQNEKRPVKVEIQLRTIAMEFWANLEHRIRYKKNIDKKILNELSNELNECAQICAMLDLKMENIHNKIKNI